MDSDDDFLYEDTDSGNEEEYESDEQVGYLKVIRKFFKTITKVLDGISGITKKHDFFPFKGL